MINPLAIKRGWEILEKMDDLNGKSSINGPCGMAMSNNQKVTKKSGATVVPQPLCHGEVDVLL